MIDTEVREAQGATDALLGQFFHSLDDENQVQWQGQILSSPAPGIYQVQLYEWVMGAESVRRLMKVEDMLNWLFYPDEEAWRFSAEFGAAREGGPHRKSTASTA